MSVYVNPKQPLTPSFAGTAKGMGDFGDGTPGLNSDKCSCNGTCSQCSNENTSLGWGKGSVNSSVGMSGFGETDSVQQAMDYGAATYEQLQTAKEDPCGATGAIGAVFAGLLTAISPYLAPLGAIAATGICNALGSKKGREIMAKNMKKTLMASWQANPDKFIALLMGTDDGVIRWYNQLDAENKLTPLAYGEEVAVIPAIHSGSWGVYTQQYYNYPGILNSEQFKLAFTPGKVGNGWDNLLRPGDPKIEKIFSIFTQAFVLAMSQANCPEDGDLWGPFGFAYLYTMNWRLHDILGDLETYYKPAGYSMLNLAQNGGAALATNLDGIEIQLDNWYQSQKEKFSADVEAGRVPVQTKCTTYKNNYKPPLTGETTGNKVAGIEELYTLAQKALQDQALKVAKEKNPQQFNQVVGQDPSLQNYLRESGFFSAEAAGTLKIAGLGVLALGLALAIKGRGD